MVNGRDAIAEIDIDHRRIFFKVSNARRQKIPSNQHNLAATLYTMAATMLEGWMRMRNGK